MHQLHTFLSSAHTFLPGYSDIALYGPIYVTTACFHDGPARTADESPLSGQCRNGERPCMGSEMSSHIEHIWESGVKRASLNCKMFCVWFCFSLLRCAVYCCQHSYARSVHPTVCTHADINCCCRGMCFNISALWCVRALNLICLVWFKQLSSVCLALLGWHGNCLLN